MKKLYFILAVLLCSSFTVKSQTIVTFYTNHGSFEVELYDTIVPITTQNFKDLVNAKFYDGVIFHRIISNFMIQGGDPTGTGSGGPGYTIPDEFDSSLSNIEKTISMANAGPNTGGSQFFINTRNNTYLDFDKPPFTSKHPVFGIVISGWDTVEAIEAVPTNAQDRPFDEVIMDSVRVTQIPLGFADVKPSSLGVSVFPNPLSNESVISVNSTYSSTAVMKLYTINGQVISTSSMGIRKGSNIISMANMKTGGLSNGLYILSIQTDRESITVKFTK